MSAFKIILSGLAASSLFATTALGNTEARSELPCSFYGDTSHSSLCPATVFRTTNGAGHIVIETQTEYRISVLDFENALEFAEFTSPLGTPVFVSRDDERDEYYVAIGEDEYFIIPEAFLIGG